MKIVLALGAVALGVLLALQWLMFPAQSPVLQVRKADPPVLATDPAAPGGLQTPVLGDEASFDVIDQRPIFVWDRKPVEKDVAAPPPAPEVGGLETLQFTGVVISPRGPMALVKDSKGGGMRRVTHGDLIGAWKVKKIELDGLILVTGAREERLALRVFNKVLPPVPGAPVVPGQPVVPGMVPQAGMQGVPPPGTAPNPPGAMPGVGAAAPAPVPVDRRPNKGRPNRIPDQPRAQ